jgi:oxygen-dependent protoporphyrinogen oxidase
MRVAVIGAGAAGCAAAHRLAVLGHEPFLIEAEEQIGGRARQLRQDGWCIDTGAFMLAGNVRSRTHELIEELGHADAVTIFEPTLGMHDGERSHLLRPSSLIDVARLPAVGWGTKLRLLLSTLGPKVDVFDERPLAEADTGETVERWAYRRFGGQGYDYVVRPTLQLFGGDPEAMFAPFAARLMRMQRQIKVIAVDGGIGSLPEWLSEGIETSLGSAVAVVEPGRDSVRVVTEEGELLEADAAVIATDARRAARLLAHEPARAALAAVHYVPALNVALGFESNPWPDARAVFVLPVGPDRQAVGALVQLSLKSPGAVPAGSEVVQVYFGKRASAHLTDADALLAARRGVAELLGGPVPEPAFEHVFRHVGIPAPRPGTAAGLLAIPDSAPPRVALAGDYLTFGSVETAIRSGERAAERLHAELAGRPVPAQLAATPG